MENLTALYEELLADYTAKKETGTKADSIRSFVTNLSEYMDDKRLCLDVVFTLACPRVQDLDKGYFTKVVRNTWTTEIDEKSVEWIIVDKPKGRWRV